jgi:RNA recognition motif-containing protein
MNIYVANLGFNVRDEDLKKHFSKYGEVEAISIIIDKITNRSRGFGFVMMNDAKAAETAIRELNGITLDNRIIRVKENQAKRRIS